MVPSDETEWRRSQASPRSVYPLGRLVALSGVLIGSAPAQAGRPLVTDDASVVGGGVWQLESWARGDLHGIEQALMLSAGLGEKAEVAIGGVAGLREASPGGPASSARDQVALGAAGPVLQAKLLLWRPRPRRQPGLAVAAGVRAPAGSAEFAPPGWEPYGYLAFSESFSAEERLLLHANVGATRPPAGEAQRARLQPLWGIASQFQVVGPFHAIAEIFSGDPYAVRPGGHGHAGFRYAPGTRLHLDATAGLGLWGEPRAPLWVTVGVRLATE